MKDSSNTNQKVIAEISTLKKRIQTLKNSEAERKGVEWALRERNKELNCLYGISAILELPDISLDEILKRIVMLIPPAWQFPEITEASIALEGRIFQTARFRETSWMQKHEVIVNGMPVGQVEVCYLEEQQASDEGPFLKEERKLLNAITERLGRIIERKRSTEELQESEDRYRSLFENSIDAVLLTAPDGRILAANPEACRIFGHTEEEICRIGRAGLMDLTDPRLTAALEERVRTGQFRGELTFVRKDGASFPGEISSVIFRDRDGNPKTSMIIRDITERKLAMKALRESEEKYRWMLDNMADVITLMDMNLRFTYVSPSIIRMRGYTAEEAVAQTFEQVMTPESLQISTKVFEEEMRLEASGTADPNRVRIVVLEQYRKDGSIVLMENHLSFMRDEAKKPVGIISVSHDITERNRAKEALQKTNLELLAIIDNLPFLAWLKDSEGRFIAVNEPFSHSCGLSSPNDLVGKTDLDIWPMRLAEAYRADDLEVMRAGQKKSVEELIVDQGVQKWFETYKAPLYDAKGNVTGTTGFARNITERKLVEKQLKDTLGSLRKAVGVTIQVLASAVETRDPYTSGHQTRSADLARAIAIEMELPQDKIEGIRMAGSIHDIGKLSIPAEILSKPTKLSEIEFALIKEHANRGYEMLKDVVSQWPLAEIVRQHHKRMDGSGYPRNLKGEEILIEARILAVADTVEAMASHRPYRAGLGIEAALNEIEKNRGTLYDKTVADTCLILFREKGFKLEGTVSIEIKD